MMNFISQHLGQLTSGGKIYITFQIFYIFIGIYGILVLKKLTKELKQFNENIRKKNDF